MLTQAAPQQQVLILRHLATSTSLFQLQDHLDAGVYTCLTCDLTTRQDNHAAQIVRLLEELDWNRTLLVAHGIDAGLAKRVISLAPERIAGLFLIGLAPSPDITLQHTPTMIVASRHTAEITSRLFTAQIQSQLPSSECVLFDDDSLLHLNHSCATLAELLHAFCSLRIGQQQPLHS